MLTLLLLSFGMFFEIAYSDVTGATQNFAMRLINPFGNNSKEGRLEIYYSGVWGTVCDDHFTNLSARVACSSLSFGNSYGAVIGDQYGAGAGPIWLDDVTCTGTESGIEQCAHRGWGVHNCSHSDDVSISCDCGNRSFSGPTGIISSPNYPLAYANNLGCNNYISVTSGKTIIITFLSFNTEQCCDWVTITCESGNGFIPVRFSGLGVPSVLTISSCQLLNLWFRTDFSVTNTGFSLVYNITSETVIGGITTKPSNAFPRSDKNDRVIFNCTSNTKSLPWWTINGKVAGNYTLTNSSCAVITSVSYSSWFMTETLGPGSCNLIVIAPGSKLNQLAGSFVCTDSTLAYVRALMIPINLELNVTGGMNSSSEITDIVRDEELRISCTPSFNEGNSNPLVFTYSIYGGGPIAQLRISRTYWTSQGNNVSGFNTSTNTYVLVKATASIIPPYTCNIVCEFFSNISFISGSYSIEISESTEPVEVLFWPAEENMTISGDDNYQIRSSGLLFCIVPANPPATYQWKDESNGIITNSQVITVIHSGKFTCIASNFIRGQRYQQSKSINVEVLDDDTYRLKVIAIILGVLLGVAVLIIIIILASVLIRKRRQQNANTTAEVGHVNHSAEQELQERGKNNRYEIGDGIPEHYEILGALQRPLPPAPAVYQELNNQ